MDHFSAKSGGKQTNKQSPTGSLTLFRVWVCPMRMRALEEMMERQKLMRMTERSERMYLQQKKRGGRPTLSQPALGDLWKAAIQARLYRIANFLKILCAGQTRMRGEGRERRYLHHPHQCWS